MIFDEAVKLLFENEGITFTNDPHDKGGETVIGITKRDFPEYFHRVFNLMKSGNIEAAKIIANEFYYEVFWNPLYENLNEKLAIKLFDIGVNIGVTKAVKILQTTLQTFDKDIVIDGVFGTKTLKSCNEIKLQESLYSRFVFELSQFYASLNQPRFFNGWLNRLYR
jgi:lysozyme family protein